MYQAFDARRDPILADRAIRSSSPTSEFLESEYREAQAEASRELQLVLDERAPLTIGEVAPFFPPAIPDPLAVRADGPV